MKKTRNLAVDPNIDTNNTNYMIGINKYKDNKIYISLNLFPVLQFASWPSCLFDARI